MMPHPKDLETIDPYMFAAVTSLTAMYHILATLNVVPCIC